VNPYLARKRGQRIGDPGRASERRLARRLGGRQIPGSGAGAEKGDIDLPAFRVEAKSTTGSSLGLQYRWLSKIVDEARMAGKSPAVALTFTHADGRPVPDGRWIAIREEEFRRLTEARDGEMAEDAEGA